MIHVMKYGIWDLWKVDGFLYCNAIDEAVIMDYLIKILCVLIILLAP
jgi:hypothetical protein